MLSQPLAPQSLTNSGNRSLDFHNAFPLLRSTSSDLFNNRTDLIRSKFGLFSFRSFPSASKMYWVFIYCPFQIFFSIYLVGNHAHVGDFLTFTGHQETIRVWETKILMVPQYLRPTMRSNFFQKGSGNFAPFGSGFGVEPVLPKNLSSLQIFNFLQLNSLVSLCICCDCFL